MFMFINLSIHYVYVYDSFTPQQLISTSGPRVSDKRVPNTDSVSGWIGPRILTLVPSLTKSLLW